MVTSEEVLKRIKQIVERKYTQLTISVLGRDVFTPEELKELEAAGVDTDNKQSLLDLIYQHNFINHPLTTEAPTDIGDMITQQSAPNIKPSGAAHEAAIVAQNNKTKEYIDKLMLDVSTRIQGIVRDNNDEYRLNALRNLDRTEIADQLAKESSLGKVKQLLKDTSGQANRDWQRVAVTEMSNMIGISSVDRIVVNNQDKDLDEVYCYRIIVGDAKTCKHCRKFYGDIGQVPKIYKLSTLIGNGTNYGKKQDQWLPVVGATHPNTRTSQVLEVRPGFEILPGGKMNWIGRDKWKEWIFQNLQS